jgi:hypothetical protein
MGTSCVVCNHKRRLGRMWSYNFAGKSEFCLLLQDAEGLEFGGIYATAEIRIEIFSRFRQNEMKHEYILVTL